MADTQILLTEHEIPTHWYNGVADMLHPPARRSGPMESPSAPMPSPPFSQVDPSLKLKKNLAVAERPAFTLPGLHHYA